MLLLATTVFKSFLVPISCTLYARTPSCQRGARDALDPYLVQVLEDVEMANVPQLVKRRTSTLESSKRDGKSIDH